MDEVWIRIALIGGALIVAASAILFMRWRARGPVRDIESTGLTPGVYLFSSTACEGCGKARRKLGGELGDDGFVEFSWEADPGRFHDLGVTAVPATLVVEGTGAGTLYPGQPEKALAAVGP